MYYHNNYNVIRKVFIVVLFIVVSGINFDLFGKNKFSCTDTLLVMSWNVENLFDLITDGTEYMEYIRGKCNWNLDTYSKKLNNIASVIASANPDIAILSEIENTNVLENLKSNIKDKGINYKYATLGDSPVKSSVHVAIISKCPILKAHCIRVMYPSGRYGRDILEADVKIKSKVLKLFGVHWPSKRSKESKRVIYAKVLNERLKRLPPNLDYIILGDFNSNYNEAESLPETKNNNTNGLSGLNHILRTAISEPNKEFKPVSEELLLKNHNLHYDLWLELLKYKRMSYVYRNKNNTLDHIILPYAMYDSSGISYLDNSFRVYRWGGKLIYNNKPYRWQIRYKNKQKFHVGKGYSDHLPILASFYIGGFSKKIQ